MARVERIITVLSYHIQKKLQHPLPRKPCAFIQLLDQIICKRNPSLLLGKYHTKTKRNKEGRSIEKNESLVIASKFGIFQARGALFLSLQTCCG